jgi:four helix bundle protein
MGLPLNSEEQRYQSEQIGLGMRGRRINAEMARFVSIAMGSANELDHHLLLSKDLGYLGNDHYRPIGGGLTEIRKDAHLC